MTHAKTLVTFEAAPASWARSSQVDRVSRIDHDTFIRLVRSRDFFAANLDRPLRLAHGAHVACLSPFHYQRLFLRAFGETPHAFVSRSRLAKARHLLANDSHSVTEKCLAVGYSSLGTFSSTFAQTFACSPSEYRRAVRRVFPSGAIVPSGFVPTCLLRWWRTAVWPTAEDRKIEEAFAPLQPPL